MIDMQRDQIADEIREGYTSGYLVNDDECLHWNLDVEEWVE